MDENRLGLFFAKHLLRSDFCEEKGRFIASVFESAREGHLCFRSTDPPSLPTSVIEVAGDGLPKTPIVQDQDRFYLQKNWIYETRVLDLMSRLRAHKIESNEDSSRFFEMLHLEKRLSPTQKAVVQHMFDHRFSIVCGGPGTGKTYTAGIFVSLLLASMSQEKRDRYRIVLSAPTGKAALHLQMSLQSKSQIPCHAMTLHRLLDLKPNSAQLLNQKRIDAHLVIVDEASMMDASLFAHLLEMIGPSTRLILMGDPNQLPPVEMGSLFADCADCYAVFLKECMRTSDVFLQKSSQAILEGNANDFFASVSVEQELETFVENDLYERVCPMISQERVDPEVLMERLKKRVVLNALRKGPFGLEALNQRILEKMEKECPDGWWWAAPVLVTANCPHLNLYNGSFGVLIGRKRKIFRLSEAVCYFPSVGMLETPPPYELGFVLSIHKSQGSEFDEVVALFPEGSEVFGKESLYTAATRARKKWEVIGKQETLLKLLLHSSFRSSGLKDRLASKQRFLLKRDDLA